MVLQTNINIWAIETAFYVWSVYYRTDMCKLQMCYVHLLPVNEVQIFAKLKVCVLSLKLSCKFDMPLL